MIINSKVTHSHFTFHSFLFIFYSFLIEEQKKSGNVFKEHKKKGCKSMIYNLLAEREGFEPPVPRSTTVFKTAAIDHSAISPNLFFKSACFQKRCKGTTIF